MPRNPFIYETRVRFGDTDASGPIFYASLLRHFDAAETEFIRSINWTYKGLGFPTRARGGRFHFGAGVRRSHVDHGDGRSA
jgi:acyl-CoA thioesterase FadM